MKKEKLKDSRINSIWLLSNGWIVVSDKQDKNIKELCGAYSISTHNKLKDIAPEVTAWHGFSKGHIEFAVDNLNYINNEKSNN